MKLESLVKSACDDWSKEARVPAGLADRALRGRTRRRSLRVVLAAGSTALLVVAGMVVLFTTGPTREPARPAVQPVPLSPPLSQDTTVRKDLGSSFPRRLVAAGHTAVAAYYTIHNVPSSNGQDAIGRTWYLYDPVPGTYEKTSWAHLDVAPGMHQAAVLEGPLPTSRVGVLDMKTRRVTRWISVGHPVGGVAWSPDGRRLLLTAYAKNPDLRPGPGTASRTGYYVVDAGTGRGTFRALTGLLDNFNSRQDVGWSRNGALIWVPTSTRPTKIFFDLGGERRPAPAHEDEYDEDREAGLSPNGTLLPGSGPPPGPSVTIRNVKTDKVVAVLPIQQARAWADDDRLFAIGCDPKNCKRKGEFRNRLLLVGLDGKITPLTGYQRSDRLGSWTPVFTHR